MAAHGFVLEHGDTPLIHAARHGLDDDARSLLANGADVNERKASGCTALYIACPAASTSARS